MYPHPHPPLRIIENAQLIAQGGTFTSEDAVEVAQVVVDWFQEALYVTRVHHEAMGYPPPFISGDAA
jgi:hypothetical protein